jgi:hypothetical protein
VPAASVTQPFAQQFPSGATEVVFPRAATGTRTLIATTTVNNHDIGAFPAPTLLLETTVNPPSLGGDLDLLLRNR